MQMTYEQSIGLLNSRGANVTYDSHFLPPALASRILHDLMAEVVFNRPEDSSVVLFGRRLLVPRLQVAYGDPETCYEFSRCLVHARPWSESPTLFALRPRVEAAVESVFNFVLLNLYRSGADSIGWHRDDEADLEPTPTIASQSFGAVRDFQFRQASSADSRLPTVTLPLEHGSLLVMRHPTNVHWKHQLPKRGGDAPTQIGPRLNLTWRRIFLDAGRRRGPH